MSRKEELKAIIGRYAKELNDIENTEQTKRIIGLVGKFFRSKETWGRGKSWYIYIATTRIDHGLVAGWGFEKNVEGVFTISMDYKIYNQGSFEEIEPAVFWKAWRKLIAELNAIGGESDH